MLNNDYTTKLLDMEHMNVKEIENFSDRLILHAEMKRRPARCPCCGILSDTVYDYRIQSVRDCPVQGKMVYWQYRKRRYRCTSCGKRFYHAAVADLPEFEPLLRVLRNWTQYILNAFDCKYTNGFTEGCNNKIKELKRIAFGYRNFTNFRQRILLSFNTP